MPDMLGREDAISVAEAKRRLALHVRIRKPRRVKTPVEETYNRILAEDISSAEDLPAFSRSTVDGYAVSSSDTFGASESLPSYLNLTYEVSMGEMPSFVVEKGTAAKIPTGGMLPSGADAVVMLENAQVSDGGLIEVLRPVAPGENVITAGEDLRKGEFLLKEGSLLMPHHIAAFAGIGVTKVEVYERPRVSIISTGDEIVDADSSPGPGEVRDINSYNLAGLIIQCGCIPVKKGIFRDVFDDIKGIVEESLRDSDAVVITGGSSVGMMDMTAKVINASGPPGVIFHGVALKPGKPTIGGVIRGVPVFGLPGHPAAVTVCFDIFIRPVLWMLTGLREKEFLKEERVLTARLSKNLSSGLGREEHVRVRIEKREGELWATPVLGKSGLIKTLVLADGTITIPVQSRGIQAGEEVQVKLF